MNQELPTQPNNIPPSNIPPSDIPPFDIPDTESVCEPEPCVPTPVDMTLELVPVVTLCVQKPSIKLKNNAVCICKPCKKPPTP